MENGKRHPKIVVPRLFSHFARLLAIKGYDSALALLRTIHRRISVFYQLTAVRAVLRKNGDADARLYDRLHSIHGERLSDGP
jgi:hypothetical protein